MPRQVVDVAELIERKAQLLDDLKDIPNKERDYGEYIKVCMKIKYHTDKEERQRKLEAVRRRMDDPETRAKHNLYCKIKQTELRQASVK